jgi:predicted nuclease of predicted toxin-antitoxin system
VTPRLYLDEDVLPDLAQLLRARGYDAVSAQEWGAFKLTDSEQLERACADQRTILTYNYRHFLDRAIEWGAEGLSHFGIVISYRQYSREQLGEVARVAESMLQSLTAEGLVNAVIVLDDFRP